MTELLTVGQARDLLGVRRFTFDTKYRPHLNEIKRGRGAIYFERSEVEEMRDNSSWENQEGAVVFKRRTVKDALDYAWKVKWSRAKDPYKKESLKRVVEREIGSIRLSALDYATLEDWITKMRENDLKPATIRSRVYTLTYALGRVRPLGWVGEVDMPELDKVVDNERDRWLTWDEEALLFKALDQLQRRKKLTDRDATVMLHAITFLIRTGARPGEFVKVREDWLSDDSVTFKIRKVPGSKNVVPLSDDAKDAIIALLDSPYWRGLVSGSRENHRTSGKIVDWLGYRFDKIRKQAGLDSSVMLYTLRHTCASRLAQAGVGVYQIKEWMGHSDVRTTQRYMHLAPTSLKASISAVTPPKQSDNVVPIKGK